MLIKLDRETHKYSVDANWELGFLSTSKLVSMYHEGFDVEYHLERLEAKTTGKYAGMNKEQIRQCWVDKRNFGTSLHDRFEGMLHEYLLNGALDAQGDIIGQVLSVALDATMNNYWHSRMKVYTEQSIWMPIQGYQYDHIDELWPHHNSHWKGAAHFYATLQGLDTEGLALEEVLAKITDIGVGGTMDIFFVDHGQKTFSILDLKTDDKIRTFSRKRFYPPVSHLRDSTYNYYALKMSIYALMVQFWMPGYKLADLVLIHVPNGEGFKDFIELPYLKMEAHSLIRHSCTYG